MKLTASALALILISATSISMAEDSDVEIDFIKGSDYAQDYQPTVSSNAKFIDGFAKSQYANDELETDFISGSEYAAMDREENKKKSWFAFLSLK